jgi:enamine deaminase RidA (YjgF/YER057c/UK114 family)
VFRSFEQGQNVVAKRGPAVAFGGSLIYVNKVAPPASTAIGVPQLARPGALFEVEAIAVLPPK